jgi:uncharacterized protein
MTETASEEPVLLEEFLGVGRVWYVPSTGRLQLGTSIPRENKAWPPAAWELPFCWPVTRLAFATTMRCNLQCSFCYNRAHPQVAGLDAAAIRRAIDDLAAQAPAGSEIGILFSGGEPLLRRAEMVAGIEYAKAAFKRSCCTVSVTLYTNATLLDDEMVAVIRQHDIHVIVSLDGPEPIHNANRVDQWGRGGFGRTVRAIRMLQAAGLGHRLEARAVISSPDTSPADVLDAVLAQGISRVHLMPAYGAGVKLITEQSLPKWLECLKIYELLLRRGFVMEVTPFWRIFRKLAHPKRFADSHFPCTAGRQMLGVGADGAYYLCHHFSGSSQGLGLTGRGLPAPERCKQLAPRVDEREPCRRCAMRHLCGGPCYHRGFIGGAPQALADCAEYVVLLREVARAFVRLQVAAPRAMAWVAAGKVGIAMPTRRTPGSGANGGAEGG